MTHNCLEIIDWSKAREYFAKADADLKAIIDELALDSKKFPIVKVKYPYGTTIYKNGIFYLPDEISKDSKVYCEAMSLLDYSKLPVGYVSKNSFEVFIEQNNNPIPLAFRQTGLNLGIWESFSPASPYTVASGSRTFTILPKAADVSRHKNLEFLGVSATMPQGPFDYWSILKQLTAYSSNSNEQNWYCEILFFSKAWLNNIKNNKAWMPLNHYLLNKNAEHTKGPVFNVSYEAVWSNFSHLLTAKGIKLNPMVVDTFKRLIFITAGMSPAFSPATPASYAAPFDKLFDAYLNYYQLKNYALSVMYTDYYNKHSGQAVYYSLQTPTCLKSNSQRKISISARKDLFELIETIDKFKTALTQDHLGAGSEIFYDLFAQHDLEYYHSEEDINKGVYPSSLLATEDERFLYTPEANLNRSFCAKSFFVRGCVRIVSKK